MWLDTDKDKGGGSSIHHFLQRYLHNSGNEPLTIYQGKCLHKFLIFVY
jgi:hypothetical protein